MEKIAAIHAPHPQAEKAAKANCPILLTGETGTGKGHLAKWIHDHSVRRSGPFVPVNCAAIPENLVDSYLFGHAKGSFSDAGTDHLGLVRAASGGTVLFDEIGELPLPAQMRLLRLLEEREVQPLGYSKPLSIDIRVIAASNADLDAAVQQGKFRQDLFFRLEVLRVEMKPLRNRLADLLPLLDEFNTEFARYYKQSEIQFDEHALQLLEKYRWPGNVRELRTVMERLHVLLGGTAQPVTADDLFRYGQLSHVVPTSIRNIAAAVPAAGFRAIKGNAVADVLRACRGNVSRAAVRLGVHRSTIYRWMAQEPVAA